MPTTNLASTSVTFTYEVSDADPIQMRYVSPRLLPNRATVHLTDGDLSWVEVSGPNVKRDGTTGTNSHSQSYGPRDDDTPAWVRELGAQAVRRYEFMADALRLSGIRE